MTNMANGRGADACDGDFDDPVQSARAEVAAEYARKHYGIELIDADCPDHVIEAAYKYAESQVAGPLADANRGARR